MAQKILKYSISILLCLLMALPATAQNRGNTSTESAHSSSKKQEKKKDAPEVEYPLYNGINIGIDLWGPGSKLLGGDFFSTEVSASVNLKQRFFPTLEVGYGNTDKLNDNGIHYKGNAPYMRLGLDYNSLYKKAHGHMLLVGFRYGVSPVNYDVTSPGFEDPTYGVIISPEIVDNIYGGTVDYNHKGMKCTMQWLEFCVGIRAHIWKSLYMGWTMRMKYRLSASPDKYGDPWFVPGFGTYGANTMGVTYTIIYKLPF